MIALLAFLPQLATGAGWVKVAKFIFTPKNLVRLGIALAIAFCLYTAYNWIYERGSHSRDQEVATLVKERNDARAELSGLKEQVRTWKQQSKDAQDLFAAGQKAIIDDLNVKLAKAEKKAKARQKELTHDIPKYIPASADVYVPVGFLRLFNRSIEGENTAAEDGVSGSLAGSAGAPSSFTLSALARLIVIPNNDEAVRRGQIIRGWQTWYEKTKNNFTEAQRKAAEAIPKDASLAPTANDVPTETPKPPPVTDLKPITLTPAPHIPPDDDPAVTGRR